MLLEFSSSARLEIGQFEVSWETELVVGRSLRDEKFRVCFSRQIRHNQKLWEKKGNFSSWNFLTRRNELLSISALLNGRRNGRRNVSNRSNTFEPSIRRRIWFFDKFHNEHLIRSAFRTRRPFAATNDERWSTAAMKNLRFDFSRRNSFVSKRKQKIFLSLFLTRIFVHRVFLRLFDDLSRPRWSVVRPRLNDWGQVWFPSLLGQNRFAARKFFFFIFLSQKRAKIRRASVCLISKNWLFNDYLGNHVILNKEENSLVSWTISWDLQSVRIWHWKCKGFTSHAERVASCSCLSTTFIIVVDHARALFSLAELIESFSILQSCFPPFASEKKFFSREKNKKSFRLENLSKRKRKFFFYSFSFCFYDERKFSLLKKIFSFSLFIRQRWRKAPDELCAALRSEKNPFKTNLTPFDFVRATFGRNPIDPKRPTRFSSISPNKMNEPFLGRPRQVDETIRTRNCKTKQKRTNTFLISLFFFSSKSFYENRNERNSKRLRSAGAHCSPGNGSRTSDDAVLLFEIEKSFADRTSRRRSVSQVGQRRFERTRCRRARTIPTNDEQRFRLSQRWSKNFFLSIFQRFSFANFLLHSAELDGKRGWKKNRDLSVDRALSPSDWKWKRFDWKFYRTFLETKFIAQKQIRSNLDSFQRKSVSLSLKQITIIYVRTQDQLSVSKIFFRKILNDRSDSFRSSLTVNI